MIKARSITLHLPEVLITHAHALTAAYQRVHDQVDLDAVLRLAVDLGLETLAAKQGFPPRLTRHLGKKR
jgi:hypothetical protein